MKHLNNDNLEIVEKILKLILKYVVYFTMIIIIVYSITHGLTLHDIIDNGGRWNG